METQLVQEPATRGRAIGKAKNDVLLRPEEVPDFVGPLIGAARAGDIDLAVGIAAKGKVHVVHVPSGEDIPFRDGVAYVMSVSPFGDKIAKVHGAKARLVALCMEDDVPAISPLTSFLVLVGDDLSVHPSKKMPASVHSARYFAAPSGKTRYVYHRIGGAQNDLTLVSNARKGLTSSPAAIGILNHRFGAALMGDQICLVSCANLQMGSDALSPAEKNYLGFTAKHISDALWPGKSRDICDTSEWYHLAYSDTRFALIQVKALPRSQPVCTVVYEGGLVGQIGQILDVVDDGAFLVRTKNGGIRRYAKEEVLPTFPAEVHTVLRSVRS